MMYRIICSRLLVLIRLAIIVSLAGYSLSNASAAMHGPGSAEMQQSAISGSDHHGSDLASHDHHGNDVGDQDDGASKLVKQCCGDYCVSMAVPIGHAAIGGPPMESLRFFIDDSMAVGQIPVLHRPPNI